MNQSWKTFASVCGRCRPFAWALAAYSALAIALTFPLVLHLSSVVPHDIGDPLLSTAILWWNAHVLPFTTTWWSGFAFYPAAGSMAFSDSRLGESLLATPMQWLGCGPVTAYNLTLLATFPLCALAAHWLGFVVTSRHDAAAISGLAYGFCPYRIAHLQHLELLAGFGMPAALAALHLYWNTGRPRWLVTFALALTVQGLCSSYYLLSFSILLALWLLWFTRRYHLRALLGTVIAGACALAALSPLALGYARIHRYYGFERSLGEIVKFSADATSLLTADPTVMLWGWTARWGKSEGELFPGITITALALVGAMLTWRRGAGRDRLDRVSIWLLAAACICAVIAYCGWAYAPWRISIIGLRISSDAPFKPMTLCLLAIAVWIGVSSRMRDAYKRQSTFAFYAIATVFLFVCSLGPKPSLAGHQFAYEPPYAWLMRLPVFVSVRAPARFGLPATLALAISGAVAFNRVRLRMPLRRALITVLLTGIVADGWISHLALPAVPEVWTTSHANGFAAVLELPLGDPFPDLAAMYRAIYHQHPIVNGNSGFEPMHYSTLRTALEERDATAFDGLPSTGRLLVVVDKRADTNSAWNRFLTTHPRSTRVAQDERWSFYGVEPPPAEAPPCGGEPVPIISIKDNHGSIDRTALIDGNPHTWWSTAHPQRMGDSLVLDLGHAVHPCAVFIGVDVGEFRADYARKLVIETSADSMSWTVVAARRLAGLTIRAALDDPKHVAVPISLAPSEARFVRLRIDETHPKIAWLVTDFAIRSAGGPH
jgi:hypothetical protein